MDNWELFRPLLGATKLGQDTPSGLVGAGGNPLKTTKGLVGLAL